MSFNSMHPLGWLKAAFDDFLWLYWSRRLQGYNFLWWLVFWRRQTTGAPQMRKRCVYRYLHLKEMSWLFPKDTAKINIDANHSNNTLMRFFFFFKNMAFLLNKNPNLNHLLPAKVWLKWNIEELVDHGHLLSSLDFLSAQFHCWLAH